MLDTEDELEGVLVVADRRHGYLQDALNAVDQELAFLGQRLQRAWELTLLTTSDRGSGVLDPRLVRLMELLGSTHLSKRAF